MADRRDADGFQYRDSFLEDVVNSIQDGVSVLDPDLNILMVNKHMSDWYAHQTPLEGKKCYGCYQGRDLPCDPCPSMRALASGRTEMDVVPGPEGSPIEWIELFAYPVRDRASGEIVGVVEFVRDITEKKRLERQLMQAQKMEAVGTLAGGVAHDFNNILMGIQGRVSLMLVDLDPTDPQHEHLQAIEASVHNAANLTQQLLGFARAGKYETSPTDLTEVVREMAAMFGRTRKEITLACRLDDDLRPVEVDRGQIENALLNLLINAWQAMDGGGEIRIVTANVDLDANFVEPYEVPVGRYVKIVVSDDGRGMEETTRRRVFDPFFTTKEVGQGTGLGLASAYGIVKNHGGIIDVVSEVGVGTTFTIYLPVSEAAVIDRPAHDTVIFRGDGTILVVDDETTVTGVARLMLEKLGFTVLVAGNGREAVTIYREHRDDIALVILDMIMPGPSGGEVFDQLKQIDPDVRVLLSSGYSINGQAQQIIDSGCLGFIQKPFSLAELSTRLRDALD